MAELLLKDEVFGIIGAAIEVHRELGCGFLEAVYQEAIEYELTDRGLPFVRQPPLTIRYKVRVLKTTYTPDLICFGAVIVELKALERLGPREESRLINYLNASGYRVGVLINFGSPGKLEWKRFVR